MPSTEQTENPLFAYGTPPRFEEITPQHVQDAMPILLEKTKSELAAFETSIEPSWDGIFEAWTLRWQG